MDALQQCLTSSETKCSRLEVTLKERDVQIAFLLHRYVRVISSVRVRMNSVQCAFCALMASCFTSMPVNRHLCRSSFLDEAASYAPLLDQLATTLKSASFSSTVQPKVQSVKPINAATGAPAQQASQRPVNAK